MTSHSPSRLRGSSPSVRSPRHVPGGATMRLAAGQADQGALGALEVDAGEGGEVAEALDEPLGDHSRDARQHTGTVIAITIYPRAQWRTAPAGHRMRHDRTRDTRRRARLRRR